LLLITVKGRRKRRNRKGVGCEVLVRDVADGMFRLAAAAAAAAD
jgi:hypothetical protein